MKLALVPCAAIVMSAGMSAGCGGDDDGASPAASVQVASPPVEATSVVAGGGSEPEYERDASTPESTVAPAPPDTTAAPAYVDVEVDPGLGTDDFVGASEDVRLDRCELEGDHWVAAGMVTNTSGTGAGYRIYVAFNPPESVTTRGLVQVDYIIPEGESQTWKAVAWITDPALDCVLRVERVSG
jgi:hypothetical protein